VLGFEASLALLAGLGLLSARLISFAWLDDIPHVMDEIAYELQARMYAVGRIAGEVPSPLSAFNQWFVEDRGQRYGIFPPGWPAVLALGHLLGASRWVNPLLHGFTVLAVGHLGRRIGGERVGQLSALLYGFCPQALLMAASSMSHTLAALLAVLSLSPCVSWSLMPMQQRMQMRAVQVAAHAARAGLALGWLAATRPLCGAVIGVCCAAVLLRELARGGLWLAHAWALPALCVPVLAFLAYNHALTGDALLLPQTRYFESHIPPIAGEEFRYAPHCNSLGFGVEHGCEITYGSFGHTPQKALVNTGRNLITWLSLAAGGGMLALAALCALLLRSTRSMAALLLAPAALVVPAYALYWYVGTCYGARFYHVALPFGLLASALGLTALYQRSRSGKLSALVLGLGAAAFALNISTRARAELEDRYWATDARFRRLVEEYQGPPALVLVAFRTQRLKKPPDSVTGTGVFGWSNGIRILSAQQMNRPLLDGPIVFARYHPALIPAVQRSFPERKLLVYVMADHSKDDAIVPHEQLHLQLLDPHSPVENFPGLVLRDTSGR